MHSIILACLLLSRGSDEEVNGIAVVVLSGFVGMDSVSSEWRCLYGLQGTPRS
jgi:hypothetical protein